MATMVKFIDTASAGLTIDPARLQRVFVHDTGQVRLNFSKYDGSTTFVTLTVTDGAEGVEQKRAFQALANALGGHPRHGAVVEIADDVDGKYIHRDITGVAAISL
tara:strand:- start:1110 stop:1424 length:315 start_codon:yes stop_codon:yes gene_type:complete